MPSHSTKQAKVMSAIAHGWRPSGLKIPVKVAKDFHAADAGKKYGAGDDKKARALRVARKAEGGGVEDRRNEPYPWWPGTKEQEFDNAGKTYTPTPKSAIQIARYYAVPRLEAPDTKIGRQLGSDDIRRMEEFRRLLGPQKAGGGSVGNFNPERASAFGLAKQGMIKSSVPGRTDKLNLDVPSGSYIIPADVVSARGQGNSAAGASIMDKMFNKGPYGMSVGRAKGPRLGTRQTSLTKMNKRGFAGGGDTGLPTPIVAAGGEYVVHPETVASLGNGDISLGHDILDAFVKHTREQHIATLKGLKPPKGSS